VVLAETTPEAKASSWEDQAQAIREEVTAHQADLVLAFGGDGTVALCAQALLGTSIPLGVVPCGAANLAAKALHAPHNPQRAVQAAISGRERVWDVVLVDGRRVALTMVGMGADALVISATPEILRRSVGWPAYLWGAAGVLGRPPLQMRLRLDQGPPVELAGSAVVAANTSSLPGGIVAFPEARPDDGLLEVAVIKAADPQSWVSLFLALGIRQAFPHHTGFLRDRHIERFRCRSMELEAAAPEPRQADGERLEDSSSLRVEVVPRALLLMAP
jgi:diacylglycerol kinase family enzyme